MSEKRFTIKPQDDYWAVVDNYNDDKVCIINGIHTEIEAIWVCDFMNEQQAIINEQKEAIEYLKTVIRYTLPNQMVADVFKEIGEEYE